MTDIPDHLEDYRPFVLPPKCHSTGCRLFSDATSTAGFCHIHEAEFQELMHAIREKQGV